MKSLEHYLDDIYTLFDQEVQNMENLCTIASLNYQSGRLPDYTDIHVQQLYLLKYAYAYTYEYYLMYDKAIRELGIHRELTVVSLGCGAMTDYMGLQAIEERRALSVQYTGVDLVDWSYKPYISPADAVVCRTGITVGNYFREIEELDADIYMFPKSISEISVAEVEEIAACFRQKVNKKERFAVCISLRNSPVNRNRDLQKAEKLEAAVMESGYIPGAENNCYFIVPKNCGIKKFEKNYNYPSQAAEALKQLGNRCRMSARCRYSRQCKDGINRYPVLKTGEICYKVMTFERRKIA